MIVYKKISFLTVLLLLASQSFLWSQFNQEDSQGKMLLKLDAEAILNEARSGNAYAQSIVGIFYRTGELGFPVDFKVSEDWTQKALEQNHPVAKANMGSLEMEKRNIAQANYYYQEAFLDSQLMRWADDGDPVASYCLGVIYSESNPKDYGKALQYFLVASESGFASAQAQMATMYFVGMGIGSDPEKAVQWSLAAQEREVAAAYFNIGIAYSLGQGVEKNMQEAFKNLKISAERGFAQAQLTLGMKYVKAHGTPQDYIMALKWFKTALENGMIEAKGPLMKYSIFVSEDELKDIMSASHFPARSMVASAQVSKQKPSVIEVVKKNSQSQQASSPSSMARSTPVDTTLTGDEFEDDFVSFTLNIPKLEDFRYKRGEVPEYRPIGNPSKSPYVQSKIEDATKAILVKKDYGLAERMLRNLALQGDAVAQRSLGELYFSSEGSKEPNYKTAYEWLEKAAIQGDVLAQRYVGMMFFIGNAPEQDYKTAKIWLSKAAKQGDQEAQRHLDIFERVFN